MSISERIEISWWSSSTFNAEDAFAAAPYAWEAEDASTRVPIDKEIVLYIIWTYIRYPSKAN